MTGKKHERAIIQGKLFPATGTRKPLPRPRLDSSSDVLDGIFQVVVLAAPAGYGKSTLMARWQARLLERGVSCAWLSYYEEARLVATRFDFHELTARGGAPPLHYNKALRAASRYLLKQSPKVIVEVLDAAIENSRQRGLVHRSVELLVLRALAKDEDGDRAGALADLRHALTIAAPRNYVRVFLDEARGLGPLLDRLDMEQLRGSEAAPLARRLQRAMRALDVHGGGAPIVVGEELTKRELSILKRLESGLSNKEIAEAIFVSEGTLKWHLHNVYGKLNVKNRTGAMARARALGIL